MALSCVAMMEPTLIVMFMEVRPYPYYNHFRNTVHRDGRGARLEPIIHSTAISLHLGPSN